MTLQPDIQVVVPDLNTVTDTTTISEQMFGGIYTTFQHRNFGLSDYHMHAEQLGLTNVRWPGGHFAKSKQDSADWDGDGNVNEYIYDLANNDLSLKADYTGNSDFGLSGVLGYSVENEIPFSMIVPVERYYNEPVKGEEVLRGFLERLVTNGEFGELPTDFTLEMGNENFGPGQLAVAADYGETSDRFISVIREFLADDTLNPNDVNLKIGLQGSSDMEMDEIIRDSISSDNSPYVDKVIFHYLNPNIRNGQRKAEEREVAIENWEADFGADLEVFASAWTVGRPTEVTGLKLEYTDVGAATGRSTLDTMISMAQSGVDSAAVWGVDINYDSEGIPENPNWFSSGKNGEVVLSHSGYVVSLMAESISGSELIFSSGNETTDGYLINGEYPGLDSAAIHAFQGSDQLVLFVAANNIDDSGELVEIDVSAYVENGIAAYTRIYTEWNDINNDYDDVALRADNFINISGGFINVPIEQDYEVIRIVIEGVDKSDASPNGPQISHQVLFNGDESNNTIVGNEIDNILNGHEGDDTLFGGGGADVIDGADGIDTLDFSAASGRAFADIQFDQRGKGFLTFYDEGQPEGDVYAGIENITGGDFADNLRGDGGANVLFGGGVSDRLYGRDGDDILLGGDGADALYGNRGADTMSGGDQAGRSDRFIFFNTEESGVGEGNRDVITDFVPHEDRIEISRIDAETMHVGKQRFDFVGDDAFSGTAGELRYGQIGGDTIVQADLDGDGVADFEIELTGLMTLTESDFLL